MDPSGHVRPAETPTAEVIAVTDDPDDPDDPDSSAAAPEHVTLTSSVSVTASPSPVEGEASSPEIITFIPKSNASSGAEPLDDIQGKHEQEGLGENPEVLLSKTPNITDGDVEQGGEGGNNQTSGSDEESGESSGETAEIKPELLAPTSSSDQTPEAGASPSEGNVPHVTPTPGWEQSTPPSTPQESRSDREHSAEPPVTKEPDHVSEEHGATAEISTSSINGESEAR